MGQESTTQPERELRPFRPRVRPVFQDRYGSFGPRHRTRDAVAPLKAQGRWTAADDPARVAGLLDRVGLAPSYGDRGRRSPAGCRERPSPGRWSSPGRRGRRR
ncbi:hypothetical protein [Streptomyces sp. ALI-76-A]|uniref:hypothetical protein n=1 Tax=Streptomyces sp. ALI-76-A TaxID=3025736 RepID=UPI003364E4AE